MPPSSHCAGRALRRLRSQVPFALYCADCLAGHTAQGRPLVLHVCTCVYSLVPESAAEPSRPITPTDRRRTDQPRRATAPIDRAEPTDHANRPPPSRPTAPTNRRRADRPRRPTAAAATTAPTVRYRADRRRHGFYVCVPAEVYCPGVSPTRTQGSPPPSRPTAAAPTDRCRAGRRRHGFLVCFQRRCIALGGLHGGLTECPSNVTSIVTSNVRIP